MAMSNEEMHVDYARIRHGKTSDERLRAVQEEAQRCEFVSLTDLYTHYDDGGAMMAEYLGADHKQRSNMGQQRMWTIQILQDEWGNKPKPGDVYLREVNKQFRDIAGRKLTGSAINDAKRRGTFRRDFVDVREYVIDERGCISCSFDDAGWMLSEYGVRYDDHGIAICGRRELSGGPCKAPDGSMKHVHYWRYCEAPPWVYESLPKLNKDGEPKRARSSKPKTDEQSTSLTGESLGDGGGQE